MIRGNSMLEMYGNDGGGLRRRPMIGQSPTYTGSEASRIMGGGYTPPGLQSRQQSDPGSGAFDPWAASRAGGSQPSFLRGNPSGETAPFGSTSGSVGNFDPWAASRAMSNPSQGQFDPGAPPAFDPWARSRGMSDDGSLFQQGRNRRMQMPQEWDMQQRSPMPGGDMGGMGAMQSMYGRPFTNGY